MDFISTPSRLSLVRQIAFNITRFVSYFVTYGSTTITGTYYWYQCWYLVDGLVLPCQEMSSQITHHISDLYSLLRSTTTTTLHASLFVVFIVENIHQLHTVFYYYTLQLDTEGINPNHILVYDLILNNHEILY